MSDRYGPFSVYYPGTTRGYSGYRCGCDLTHGQSCARCDGGPQPAITTDWDPATVLRTYVETAAANGAQWAIDQLGGSDA
jgi:hypothetical protein